jgi:hypothetical protein
MKKATALLLLLLMVLICSSHTLAQTSDSGTITVSAEVSPTFIVEAIQDLDFGNLLQASQKTINALTGAVNTGGGANNSLPGGQRGGFVVIADAGSEVKFSLSLPANLSPNPATGASLIPDFSRLDGTPSKAEVFIISEGDISGTVTNVSVSGAEFGAISSNSTVTVGDGGEYFSFPENEITAGGQNGNGVAVVIGGKVSVAGFIPLDQYSGEITLTVEVED